MRIIDAEALWRKFSINPNTGERYRTRDCDNFHIDVHLASVQREIMSAPTVCPVKHGRWESVGETLRVKCSVCKSKVSSDGSQPTHYRFFAYCPDCGAKMDLEAE